MGIVGFDIGEFINGLIRTHKINEWIKSVFGLALTWFITSTGASGTALMSHTSWPVAVGTGLVAGAGAVLLQAMNDPILKGVTFTWNKNLPVNASDFQTETREK